MLKKCIICHSTENEFENDFNTCKVCVEKINEKMKIRRALGEEIIDAIKRYRKIYRADYDRWDIDLQEIVKNVAKHRATKTKGQKSALSFDEMKDEIIRDLDVLCTFFDERHHTYSPKVLRVHEIQDKIKKLG